MENLITTPVPFIRTGQALQSLRDSGYSIEAALGEVIDNSIEANANNIHIYLFKKENKKGKKYVNEIAIIDDGDGMSKDVLQYYPQIGYSTRYMRTDTIGKYGVGAKLAALNFGRRFDVWSRNNDTQSWSHVYFDLDEMLEAEEKGTEFFIPEPKTKSLPADWADVIKEKTGSVVLWSKIDRLEDGRYAVSYDELEANLRKELARIFRVFINGGINIFVNDIRLLAHDPLFLMEGSFADKTLSEHFRRENRENPEAKVKDHYPATLIAEEIIKVGPAKATVKITLYPNEVTRRRGMGGDEFSKKLRIPENEGSISFVRLNREVSYTNVPRIFPRGVQEADRFIGIEVSFTPTLDSYFGVRNVKRGVEPHGELRDQIRRILDKYLKPARTMLDDAWGRAAKEHSANFGEHASITQAAGDANIVMPKGNAKGPATKIEENQILEDLVTDVVGLDQDSKTEYLDKIKNAPFVVESVDFPGNEFIDIKHLSNKVIIRLNTRHRFYREMWQPLKTISELDAGAVSADDAIGVCKRAVEALTLLFIAYGKAESMDTNPDEKYRDLTSYWGQFLNTLMSNVKNVI